MIKSMAQVRITEAELAADVHGMLDSFMKDVEEGISRRSEPWNPPFWE